MVKGWSFCAVVLGCIEWEWFIVNRILWLMPS